MEFVDRRDVEIRALGDGRQNEFFVLIDLHRIVIEEFALVAVDLDEGVEGVDEVANFVFDHGREEYFRRTAVFLHDVENIVLEIALADYKLAVLADVEMLGVVRVNAKLPEFLESVLLGFLLFLLLFFFRLSVHLFRGLIRYCKHICQDRARVLCEHGVVLRFRSNLLYQK